MRRGASTPGGAALSAAPLSLLWPKGRLATAGTRLVEQAIADLCLPDIIRAIVVGGEVSAGRMAARQRFAQEILTYLLLDGEVIEHRQSVLTDLVENAALRDRIEQLLPALEALGDVKPGERFRPTADIGLERVARRLADLELLVDTVAQLGDALQDARLASIGFCALRTGLDRLRGSPEFAALERELPGLRATLSSVRSVTLGVNLAPDLTPQSATILDLGTAPVDGRRALLFRLLGGSSDKHGLTPLQRGDGGPLGRPNDLVRDLRHLLSEVVAPVQSALERFSRVSTDAVGQLGAELALLVGVARLAHRLRHAGLPLCSPKVLDAEQRHAELTDIYDPALALGISAPGENIVTNDARFDAQSSRVWVLTGPNRGGKTTYTRAVGIAQVLFQVGFFVPARSARMSLVDAIFSHFPTREDATPMMGRLDAEAERVAAIFRQATPRSLILLNEALSGTSALEALDLARGLVRALRLLGARAIYVTHLHELAACVDDINATTPGDSTVGSLVADSGSEGASAQVSGVWRTYRVVPGSPRGVSFAAEIAEQHGISFAQLARLLRERELI